MDSRSSEQGLLISHHLKTVKNVIDSDLSLLSDADKKDVLYYLYLPLPSKVHTKRYLREIDFYIAYLSIAHLASCLNSLIETFLPEKTNAKRSDAKALFQYLEELKDELIKLQDEKDLKLLSYDGLFKKIEIKGMLGNKNVPLLPLISETVDRVIKEKKISADSLPRLIEIRQWLSGLNLHYSINARRKEIFFIKSDPKKSTLVDYPVPNKGHEKISMGMSEILKMIGKMDTEESQPIILAILKDIMAKIENNQSEKITYQAIECVYQKIKKATEMDYDCGAMEKLDYLKQNKDTTLPGLEELLQALNNVERSEKIDQEIDELQWWLKGFYHHFYLESTGLVAAGADMAINNATEGKIKNKLTIGDYYYAGAVVLAKKSMKKTNSIEADEVPLKKRSKKMDELSPYEFVRRLVLYRDNTLEEQIDGLRYILKSTSIPLVLHDDLRSEILRKAKLCPAEYRNQINTWRQTAIYYVKGGLTHEYIANNLFAELEKLDLDKQIEKLYEIYDQLVSESSRKLLVVIKNHLHHLFNCMLNSPQAISEKEVKYEKNASSNKSAPALLFSKDSMEPQSPNTNDKPKKTKRN